MESAVRESRSLALKSGRGGGRLCPTLLVSILELDTDGTHWNVSDFTDGGVPVDRQDSVKALWAATVRELVEKMPSEERAKYKLPDSQVLRFYEWVFAAKDEDVPSMAKGTAGSAAKKALRGLAGAKGAKMKATKAVDSDDSDSDEEADAVTSRKGGDASYVISPKMLSDIQAHPGATTGVQLCYLSACIFLGKHASKVECEGLSYGEHPVSAALIRKNSKVAALGMQSVTASFTSARKLGTMAPLTFFFANTRDKMMNAADDHCSFARMGAHRIGTWYDKAMQVATSDAVAIEYFELSVIKGPLNGRGLPEDYDSELMERAKKVAGACEPCVPTLSLPLPGPPSGTSQQRSDNQQVVLGTQLEEVVKGIETIQGSLVTMGRRVDATHTKVDATNQKVDSLSAKVKKLEESKGPALTKEEKDKTIKCNKCGAIGHREADCPN